MGRFLVQAIFTCSLLGSALCQEPADTSGTSLMFIPSQGTAPSFLAHPQEARTGVHKTLGSPDLKLDIGTTFDLIEVRTPPLVLRLGVELFSYARTTSVEGFRLQVDALDGFYGTHVTFEPTGSKVPFGGRIRFLHRSGHLVDGHWDHIQNEWLGNQLPLAFTQDMWEAAGWYRRAFGTSDIRLYSAAVYASLARPGSLARWSSFHGVEFRTAPWSGGIGGRQIWLYAAADVTIDGIPRYYTSLHVAAGIRLGAWTGPGMNIESTFDDGQDLFSQYYAVRSRIWRVGIVLDPW